MKRVHSFIIYKTIEKMKDVPKRILAILAGGLLSCGLFCHQAKAAPIQGTIDFGGVVTFDTMSLATATRVNVWNSSFVLQDSGNFSSISPGTNATMATPWIFNPSTATPGLWSVGGFTFDLTSSVITTQNATFLDIKGVGTITGNSFDPTPGTWSFTSSNASGQDHATFSFQAQAAAVPEASSAVLFGIGGAVLLVGCLLRRKFKTA